ncbi:ABC transporter ATP-binding protein [Eoetvoesiella caeni]|uniref:Amino acid/amide ABC transporter ATP-binding protein 1 (HAAT family) n=1 Tax=Eoetvoesiella caeni TaxID=645616 RepID=A0A366H658_9BURK|nr:ATP-binding cassette domain-containing protein [Eoetvoesiella caeni]MCI2809942.1 ATP-binding cassette domain-containing protein [Eoetvoesiella caeni]NYT55818.1 ATP-binding cassette domain-containing protein [Eoetvoesiella caeni]RBP37571.1 amino acid/amide ABC transporter ATP-binding protein 1 (HAAT family) [Eoetvoesiella caeni]
MNAATPALLQVSNMVVRFGGLSAVADVSFDVIPGELLGLIGPNGAGKTTLMRSITGVVRPTSGDVQLNGESLNGMPIHKRIRKGLALSQQLVKPFRGISVLDNVTLAAGAERTGSALKALLHLSQTTENEIGREALARVGIADYAHQMPGIQPLGVLKRLEVARALALKPKLLLLDEPLAGLNSKEAHALASTIAEINRQGMTIVLIEHNLGEVMRICQRLVVLDNGRKIASGTPREVMDQPAVRAAYLGGDTIAETGVSAATGAAHA